MRKIFYDASKNFEIVDITGKKTLKEIRKEFGDAIYEELTVDESIGEAYTTKNNKLEKYDLIKEQKQAEIERKNKKNILKTKLNLIDEEIEWILS